MSINNTVHNKIINYSKNKPNMTLTVGTYSKGNEIITAFGYKGKQIEKTDSLYEIGSITKTFTASLLAKMIEMGKISLDDRIDRYIDLPPNNYYPTILQLATHRANYGAVPLNNLSQNIYWSRQNRMRQQNPLNGYDREWMKQTITKHARKKPAKNPRYNYSNFGYGVLGHILGIVGESTYSRLMTDFIENELGLSNTFCSAKPQKSLNGFLNEKGFPNWDWEDNALFAPGGCLNSTASDMLCWAKMNIYEERSYFALSQKLYPLPVGQMGLGWGYNKSNQMYSHNGGTGCFISVLRFQKQHEKAVVVLSNNRQPIGFPENGIASSLMKSL